MASISFQGLELNNRSDSSWEAESCDECEMEKYEISENLGSFSSGNNAVLAFPIEAETLNSEPSEPYIGMVFNSAEDAGEFYNMYGMRVGFTIRNTRIRRSHKDNSIIGREFVCSREGYRAKKHLNRENRVLPPRPITREGCNAMLRVATKDGKKWLVSGFVKEHNHALNPSKVICRRPQRSLYNEDEKDQKIRELSFELQRERRRRAAYQEQLHIILQYIEEHTQHLSVRVEDVNNVRVLELEEKQSTSETGRTV